MLARIRKSMEQKDQGFTLIELLVVMIIIGILAAIAIPIFLSQRAKAQDSAAKADVSTLGKEIATWFVDNSTAPVVGYTAAAAGDSTVGTVAAKHYYLADKALASATKVYDLGKASDNVAIVNSVASTAISTNWCIDVNNPQGDQKTYKYSAAGGLEKGACS